MTRLKYWDKQTWAELAEVWLGSTLFMQTQMRLPLKEKSNQGRANTVCHSFCTFWTYRKTHKNSDIRKICCNHPKIWTMRLYHRVMLLKDADGMANSVDPDLGAVWSGSALFAQAYLSENLASLQHYSLVMECRTPEREVRGSRPTAAVLCPWARHFTPRKYWLITQEAMAPSQHDWKIVDWDVKTQHNQIFGHDGKSTVIILGIPIKRKNLNFGHLK